MSPIGAAKYSLQSLKKEEKTKLLNLVLNMKLWKASQEVKTDEIL